MMCQAPCSGPGEAVGRPDRTPAHTLLAGEGSVSSCWPLSAACPFSDRLSPRTAAPARGPWLGLSGLPTRQEPFSSQLGRFFSYKVKEFIKWKQRLKSGDFSSCLSLGEGKYGPPVCKGAAVKVSQWGGPLCPRPHLPYRVQHRRPRASHCHVGGTIPCALDGLATRASWLPGTCICPDVGEWEGVS